MHPWRKMRPNRCGVPGNHRRGPTYEIYREHGTFQTQIPGTHTFIQTWGKETRHNTVTPYMGAKTWKNTRTQVGNPGKSPILQQRWTCMQPVPLWEVTHHETTPQSSIPQSPDGTCSQMQAQGQVPPERGEVNTPRRWGGEIETPAHNDSIQIKQNDMTIWWIRILGVHV